MQNKPLIELTRTAVRAAICTKCYQRPVGSESLDSSIPRQCEGECAIFSHLPQLLAAAKRDEKLSPDELMQKTVCSSCDISPSAGDFCADRLTRACPLSRYSGELILILEKLLNRISHRPANQTPC
ncbi:MAG TPA: hypothetical protein VHD56_05785 [Tepidisphaeraceae bacterium]|nr:hypothetical protein [Tepidisphaeraceae bacterium]